MSPKIIIKKNKLPIINKKEVITNDNQIIFKKDADYIIELKDCTKVNLEIAINNNIKVNLFIFSIDNNLTINNNYQLGEKSKLTLFKFYDNISTNENTIIDLNGEYADYYQGFSSITHENEEYHIIVNHNKNNVKSNIKNKCITLDKSKITMQIDSIIKKGNKNCIMDQTSRILTLGTSEAKIIPNMLIEENETEARHGSIIATFDEEEMFYFMSRGIEKEEAILLLIKGFLFSNMIVDLEKREYIMNSILKLRR